MADNLSVLDGTGTASKLRAIDTGSGVLAPAHVSLDGANAVINPATKEGVAAVATALGSPVQDATLTGIGGAQGDAPYADASGGTAGRLIGLLKGLFVSNGAASAPAYADATLAASGSQVGLLKGIFGRLAGLATAAKQDTLNTSFGTVAGYTKPATTFAAAAVGSAVTPGIGITAVCTAAGNAVFQAADGSTITVPLNVGFNQFGFAVAKVVSQTATATYTILS